MKTFEEAIESTISVPDNDSVESFWQKYKCFSGDIRENELICAYIKQLCLDWPKDGGPEEQGDYFARCCFSMFQMGLSVGIEMEKAT